MSRRPRNQGSWRPPIVAGAATALLCACAPLPTPLDMGAPAAAGGAQTVVGSAADLYTRLARGALACWFGANGGLKREYMYQADAEPPSRGGTAEIIIRVRENAAAPRGVRAFAVAIRPKGDEAAEMEITLHKIPPSLGAALKADMERWASGDIGCGNDPAGASWSPQDPNASPPLGAPAKGKVRKAAGKKA